MKLLHPQELEVFYFIPAIRKELSVQMKKKGKGQREIANLLGITEAAVSQYISSKRATGVKLEKKIKEEISKSVDKIKNPLDSVRETQQILAFLRRSRLICKYHHKFLKFIPKNCDVCQVQNR
ncbi:MAG TPA: hypothetical protein HA250_03595 [Nanoarchaeota archaeon]|nr:hypothetical protein [Nanoarchaeota archaeon]HIH34135.1 hypothetical protein [Nanoarchaeota archaeon]HIH51415.1 hypothetical protein [Nanoarchaeota archaeon]